MRKLSRVNRASAAEREQLKPWQQTVDAPAGGRHLCRSDGKDGPISMQRNRIQTASGLLDQSRTQLIGEVRQPIPPWPLAASGATTNEYRRNGTMNLIRLFGRPFRLWRTVKVTEQRTAMILPNETPDWSISIIRQRT